MKKIVSIFILSVCFLVSQGQSKLFSKNAVVSFYSSTSMENIEASNAKGLIVWEKASGKMEFAVLMKGFVFKKALMQEHFNENYVESDKYPKAIFKGLIENSSSIDLSKDNTTYAKVSGTLSMHGQTKPVATTAVITVRNGIVSSTVKFNLLLADYKIKIPSVVEDKISKKIDIAVIVPAFSTL